MTNKILRRADDAPGCEPSLGTLPIEPQFNAAAVMLFRTMISFGFSAPVDG
jgi:hypothetical protein